MKFFFYFSLISLLVLGGMGLVTQAAPITPISGGGTQTSTAPLNGYLLIGNASHTYSFIASGTLSSGGGVGTSSPTTGFAYFVNGNTISGTSSYVGSFNGATGTIVFGAPATSTIVCAGGTATGPAFTFATTTASGKFTIACSGGTYTITIPSNIGFFTNDSGYITGNQSITLNLSNDATGTASGATTINDSVTVQGLKGKSLPSLASGTLFFYNGAWSLGNALDALGNQYITSTPASAATTTINSTQASTFILQGDGISVTSTVNGSTTTFSTISTPSSLAGTYLGVSGNSLTVSSTLASSSWKFVIGNATTTNNTTNYSRWSSDTAGTLVGLTCADSVATTTLFIFEPTTSATTTVSSTIQSAFSCGIGRNTTTSAISFTPGQYFIAEVTSTVGLPLSTDVKLSYTKL